MNLAVEVLAALSEPSVAGGHASKGRKRLRRAPHTCRACDEGPDTLQVHTLCRSLGEILAKGVVELVNCGS